MTVEMAYDNLPETKETRKQKQPPEAATLQMRFPLIMDFPSN